MKTFNIDDTNEYLNEAYKKDNYKVEYTEANTGRYIIFFSGNGLYYPDTVESFENTVLKKDRYEWTNTAKDELVRHYFERIIFVRDIYKCWYGKGINENCDSIDKVVELCKDLVGGKEVVTCGNSAGGYMAVLVGSQIGADHIFSFGGQWNLEVYACNKNDISQHIE